MNPEYSYWCQIRVEFKDGAAEFGRDSGEDKIPFVPQPGMVLQFTEDSYPEEYTIKSVAWNIPQGVWWITFETDSTLGDNKENDCRCSVSDGCCVMENNIPDWIERGWDLIEQWEWADA